MDREGLFVATVRDLAETVRTGNQDEYRLLKTSGTLRALLLDDDPLLHQINRQRRRRVTFTAQAEDAYFALVLADGAQSLFWMEGISPRLALRQGPSETLKLDAWLAKRAAVVSGQDISVKEMIQQVANVEGGVHAGTARSDLERLLSAANSTVVIGGSGAITRTMLGIADVVVEGLRQLCPADSIPL